MNRRFWWLAAVAWTITGCSSARRDRPALELYESTPIETTLDHADWRDAHIVWLERIWEARESLDFAHFYASDEAGSRLTEVIEAVEEAADRGVKIRFLAEEKFVKTYPETLERLRRRQGIEVRRFDVGQVFGRGVLHAKYFIVDGREVLVGSHNFDYRSLTHIVELGARVTAPYFVQAYRQVFDLDWSLAAGSSKPGAVGDGSESLQWEDVVMESGAAARIAPVASPKGWLPSGVAWDLPQIRRLIDQAASRVSVQVLTYRGKDRDGEVLELESALKAAAARGVQVRLLVADWSKRRGVIEGLQELAALPGFTVKIASIPKWSGGEIPFARVIHAKQCVVDGSRAWLGTSNWERGYFYESRNMGLLLDGPAACGPLESFFDDLWESSYTEVVDPHRKYL